MVYRWVDLDSHPKVCGNNSNVKTRQELHQLFNQLESTESVQDGIL